MKTSLIISALSASLAAADPSDYVNFVRQIQADSPVEWDVSVAPTGSMLSPEGVGPEGSLFQLWSIHGISASEYHLDEEFVSAYTPSAGITIETGDPYELVPRTRVDQPFTVRVDISGLVHGTGPSAPPPVAGQVLLSHAAGNYPEGEHSFASSTVDNHAELASAMINTNGDVVLNYAFSNLTGPDITKVEGEEVWTVYALEGGVGEAPFTEGEVLESALLQVWPVAEAAFSGVDPTTAYDELPPITVSLVDLYPESTTVVRVYFGAPSATPTNPVDITESWIPISDSVPQDRTSVLDSLERYFPRAGAYTMEVVHTTPFGPEILARLHPVTITSGLRVNASVFSSE